MENKIDKRTKEYREQVSKALDEMSNLERLKQESVPVYYAKFHHPVPPGADREPVSEFKISTIPESKYRVEKMLYHENAGLIFEAFNKRGEFECDITPSANIINVRV